MAVVLVVGLPSLLLFLLAASVDLAILAMIGLCVAFGAAYEHISNAKKWAGEDKQNEWEDKARQSRRESEKKREEENRRIIAESRIRTERLKRQNRKKYRRINHLRSLAPTAFEKATADLFEQLGYQVRVTPPQNDGGFDIVAKRDGVKYLIECKRYSARNRVGRPEVQKLCGAMVGEKADRGIFVTTGTFTEEAKEFASRVNIDLVTGRELAKMMEQVFGGEDTPQ